MFSCLFFFIIKNVATAKTPAEPAPPQAPDHLLFADRNDAFVKFDTFDIDYNHIMKYLDPKDADADSDYISDDRDSATTSTAMH